MISVTPMFEVVSVGNECYTINDQGRTVALISSQGYIDWLLRTMDTDGPLVTRIAKEPHLCYVLGLKMLLVTPSPATELTDFHYRIEDDGATVILTGLGASADGLWATETTAVLTANAATREYAWQFSTTIAYQGTDVQYPPRTDGGFEYNNIYPHGTGRCMLFAPDKRYSCTLMTDKDGTIWRFPHQHQLHYGEKIHALQYGRTSTAGFFGEPAPAGYPVCTVENSPLEPFWPICDMYYDLHCSAKLQQPVQPGEQFTFNYHVYYLPEDEAARMLAASRPIPITLHDWEEHGRPRLDLGMNSFDRGCDIDRPDDCSAFLQRPPQLVWDRQVGHVVKGSLRITNEVAEETVWSACPPTQIPASTRLNITGMVKTEGVTGKGMCIRVRYHTFTWHPTPHVEWAQTLESEWVTGTTDGWVQVSVPELQVPPEHFDYLIWLDVVLDGTGIAWLTDMDVDLQHETTTIPELQDGGLAKQGNVRIRGSVATGSGTSRRK